jgi:glyoxylase-like metal-dependent hydrolase (beta-lactamase superfamily II)
MNKWILKNKIQIFQVLKGRSNAYLICAPKGNVLIDTGKLSNQNQLLRNITAILKPNSLVDILILTHTHFDHCQNAQSLKEKYNCKILISNKEAEFAKTGNTPLPKGTNLYTKIISALGNKFAGKNYSYTPFQADSTIETNANLQLFGSDIDIIATPGHSAGSISIIVNHEIALVGDTLFGIFKNTIYPPFADNSKLLIESWAKLLTTPCQTFLPGHGKPIKRSLLEIDYQKRKNEQENIIS